MRSLSDLVRRCWNNPEKGVGTLLLGWGLGLMLALGFHAAKRDFARDVALAALLGVAAGWLVLFWQSHPRRRLGLVPYGMTLLTVMLLLGESVTDTPWSCGLLLFAGVFLIVPLQSRVLADLGAEGRWKNLVLPHAAVALVAAVVGAVTWFAGFAAFLGAAALGTVLAWVMWYPEWLECTAEVLLLPIYRIRACGPGRDKFPRSGPVLVVSNHTAWLDPLWVGKVVPRHIIPMMTSLFYDLPFMRFLMIYVVRAIRVEDRGFRRSVPELDEAVRALDRGECVVIFPEGRVRRKEDEPIRPFGQGVWHILHQRPETPVVVCWIEGGWGSFFSYLNGPPMKNKRFDWWRTIQVAMSEPRVLDSEILSEHRPTRTYLMEACLEARRHLGLEPFPLPHPRGKEPEDETAEPPSES